MRKTICIIAFILFIASISSCEKIVHALFFSQINEAQFELPQEFSFRLPELDSVFVTTRKVQNENKSASFFVIFSNDSLEVLSDNKDYIEWQTDDMQGDINLVYNPNKRDSIYIMGTDKLIKINAINYNHKILDEGEFKSAFFESNKNNQYVLKYPYIEIVIVTMSHSILVNRYMPTQEKIK